MNWRNLQVRLETDLKGNAAVDLWELAGILAKMEERPVALEDWAKDSRFQPPAEEDESWS